MVIFKMRPASSFWPKRSAVSASMAPARMRNSSAASPTYPMPVARPMAIARKMAAISRAVPGAERNRTRLKAPATAMPAPMLPLTSIMTACTTAGRIASVTARLWLASHQRGAHPQQQRNSRADQKRCQCQFGP